MYSYFPGSIYENPANEKIEYDPAKASQLLQEAGWQERDAQGWLVKDGQPFTVTLLYGDKQSERHLTIYQEDLKKAGIDLKLKLIDYSTMFKLIDERNFEMGNLAWNSLVFPNPESDYHSKYADIPQTNNITGFKNSRVDEILDNYPGMFDMNARIAALQEMDGLVYQEHPYILNWYGPFTRILYWNKFNMPASFFTKFGDSDGVLSLWWYDAARDQALTAAQKQGADLPVGEIENHYWKDQETQP